MTDDLKLRQWDRCWPGNINLEVAVDEALARITDLEAKLQRLGRELNLAKYGEPDFAWEIHKNAVADLEGQLATAEAGEDALAAALIGLRSIVEGIDGAMNHGTWRDENSLRLKDTSAWVAAYLALAAYEARREK